VSRGIRSKIKKHYPQIAERIKRGEWYIDGVSGSGHARIRCQSNNRQVTLSLSPGGKSSERRSLRAMGQAERGEMLQ
jgi:hypothetical protein